MTFFARSALQDHSVTRPQVPHYKVISLRQASRKRHIFSLCYFERFQSVPRLRICLGSLVNWARAEKHSLSVECGKFCSNSYITTVFLP